MKITIPMSESKAMRVPLALELEVKRLISEWKVQQVSKHNSASEAESHAA